MFPLRYLTQLGERDLNEMYYEVLDFDGVFSELKKRHGLKPRHKSHAFIDDLRKWQKKRGNLTEKQQSHLIESCASFHYHFKKGRIVEV